jgi:hypothetical protein
LIVLIKLLSSKVEKKTQLLLYQTIVSKLRILSEKTFTNNYKKKETFTNKRIKVRGLKV